MLGTIKTEIKDQFLLAVKDYNSSQSCYTVESIPGDGKLTFLQNVTPMYAAKKAPNIMYTLQEIPDMADKVMDWKGTKLAGLVPTSLLEGAKINGKQVGVPSTVEAFGLLYNRTVLDKAGVDPKKIATRAQLEAAFKKISTGYTTEHIYDTREFDLDLIVTAPNVAYRVLERNGDWREVPELGARLRAEAGLARMREFKKPVERTFTAAERENLVRYVEGGGLLFSDDCNHDVNGLYAKTFETDPIAAWDTLAKRSGKRANSRSSRSVKLRAVTGLTGLSATAVATLVPPAASRRSLESGGLPLNAVDRLREQAARQGTRGCASSAAARWSGAPASPS